METICTFFLNYEQYIILLTICFFAGMAWRHHRLISRLFIIATSCLWAIYVYRYQIAVGWPALDASGERSLRELFSDGAFIRHWSSLLSAAALGGALGVAFDDTRPNQARARYGLDRRAPSRMALQFPHLHSAVGLSASSTGGALGTASMTSGAGTILSVIGT